ncbi:MAG: efflux RND transporter periplasmic adaptor subunit [Cyclobacteriaceae bacterium]
MTVNFSRVSSHGIMALTLLLFGQRCTPRQESTASPETFQVIRPLIKDTVYLREYVADIQSVQNTEIRAKAGGYLETIHVDEGEFVAAGQPLFTISRKQYEQEVLQAEAAVASAVAETKAAEVELKNTRALVEKNIVSQSELELAQAKVEALKARTAEARAHEANARLELSFAQIRAPFAGYINRIPNKTGSLIVEGSLLTTISNNNQMLVYFNVSEREYLDYLSTSSEGKPKEVQLLLANGEVYPFAGQVETAESEFDSSTGNIAFRAKFPNPRQLLKHGATGKIQVSVKLKNALLIPQKSVFEIQDKFFVYEVNDSSRVKMTSVTPSYRLPELYVIERGLSAEARVLYEGIQLVTAGERINAKLIEFPSTTKR